MTPTYYTVHLPDCSVRVRVVGETWRVAGVVTAQGVGLVGLEAAAHVAGRRGEIAALLRKERA